MDDNQFSLFDLDTEEPRHTQIIEKPISAAQIVQLRQAFEAHGFSDHVTQSEIVRSCVVRRVDSFEQLLSRDVGPILRRIKERSSPRGPVSGSAWDNREEDTWIDKL